MTDTTRTAAPDRVTFGDWEPDPESVYEDRRLDPPDAAEPVEGAATASTGLEELRAADGVDLRLVVRVTAAEMATWAPERTSRFFAGIAMAKDAAGRRALAADGTEK